MAAKPLRPDSTIRDVQPTLGAPEEYVRVVLGHLSACFKQHGNAYVRIGITGSGAFPSHKVVYTNADGGEVLFKAYAERTPFDTEIHIHTWSSARMSVKEVQTLLGEIRGFKRAEAKNA